MTNQAASTHIAGQRPICTMRNPSGRPNNTFARGYSSRYAPSTPEIAPLAPTIGTSESGFGSTCAATAATPHSR